jgi:hypothetical protein
MAACGAVLIALLLTLEQTQWIVIRFVDNPIEVSRSVIKEVVRPLGQLGILLLPVSLVCRGVSLLIRVDKGSRLERQLIKWLTFFAALMAVGFGFLNAGAWPFFVGITAFYGFPIGVGIAVMRYRLLDIDVVMNRTLVYGSLTAILAGVYLGGVTATQALFHALTSQKQLPQLVVVSTIRPSRKRSPPCCPRSRTNSLPRWTPKRCSGLGPPQKVWAGARLYARPPYLALAPWRGLSRKGRHPGAIG